MIFNIRGTSGSGKSTLVRTLMAQLEEEGAVREEHMVEGRRQPLYTRFTRPDRTQVVFLGHYNTACGGCDTISGKGSLDTIFGLVRELYQKFQVTVVFEGLIVCSDARRIMELAQEHRGEVKIIQLTTSREMCLGGIRERRNARGVDPSEPFKESVFRNVDAKIKTCDRAMERIEEVAPEACSYLSRDRALSFIKDQLEL